MTDQDVDRAELLQWENILVNFHSVYAAALVLVGFMAFRAAKGFANRRLRFLVFFGLVELGVSVFVQVFCAGRGVLGNTILPSVLMTVVRAATGGVGVLFMRPSGVRDYESLERPPIDDDDGLIVEEASRGEEEEGFPESE
jgi:tryptophan-rich sensory protein